ncbi:Chloroplast envelope membrane protein, partial [Bienertia sinuspersici]
NEVQEERREGTDSALPSRTDRLNASEDSITKRLISWEKPLSPQANQGSNLKDDGVKVENSVRPPHSDLPFEFVKNANNEFVVQKKCSGSQKHSSKEEELVKYMSKVPGFLQRDESVSDIPHSFPVAAETENEVDFKIDNLIKDQGIENPVNASDMALHSTSFNLEAATSTYMNPKAISGPDQSVQCNPAEMAGDLLRHKRFSFGIPKLTKSLSFREGSLQPPPSSSYITAKSSPTNPDKQLDDLRMKPPIPLVNVPKAERHKASAIKALLHFTVKSELPIFKFVVEENNEIFASTVRSLSTLEKANISWLFTFYSVQKVRKKSSGWKNQKVKPCGSAYNAVGQMKTDAAATSEFKTSRELVAVVVNLDDSFS